MLPKLFLIPIITGLLAQVSKFIWLAGSQKFDPRSLSFYGGMPSAHTAIAVSLMTVVGLQDGIRSSTFALATIFGLLVIRDAIGFRRYIGGHSEALNRLVRGMPEKDRREFQAFREQLGHTPLEAFVGAVLGFAISALFYLIIP